MKHEQRCFLIFHVPNSTFSSKHAAVPTEDLFHREFPSVEMNVPRLLQFLCEMQSL